MDLGGCSAVWLQISTRCHHAVPLLCHAHMYELHTKRVDHLVRLELDFSEAATAHIEPIACGEMDATAAVEVQQLPCER